MISSFIALRQILPALFREAYGGFRDDCALRLSAALSYFAILSLAPLLLIALAIAAMVLGEDAARGQLAATLQQHLGLPAAQAVESMVKSAAKNSSGWTAALVGGVTLILGATGVFSELKDALNLIWHVKFARGGGVRRFFIAQIKALAAVGIVGAWLLGSLWVTTRLSGATGGNSSIAEMFAAVLGFAISGVISGILFAAIFRVLPDVRIPWKSIGMGAALTGFLFEVGKFFLAIYLARSSTGSVYGAAGAVVLIMLWVYYASAILLFGAEFTKAHARSTAQAVEIRPEAKPVSPEDRQKAGVDEKFSQTTRAGLRAASIP